MPHWQTFLINVIKRLFSWKTIEFGYIKYELKGGSGIVYRLKGVLIFFAYVEGGGLIFFKLQTKFFQPPSQLLPNISVPLLLIKEKNNQMYKDILQKFSNNMFFLN